MAYQSHPSPPRVAAIIQTRIHRGGRQRFTVRIRRWSPVSNQCTVDHITRGAFSFTVIDKVDNETAMLHF
jgi:hypothetical protein